MAGMTSSYSRSSIPTWLGQEYSADILIPGGAQVTRTAFPAQDAVRVTATANAAAAATSITVAAVNNQADGSVLAAGAIAIPSGSLIDFGGAKLAITTADVITGATSITVRALPTAIASNDVGTYMGVGKRTVPSGTLVGRTYAERDAGNGFEPWTTGDEEVFLVLWEADLTLSSEITLLRDNTVIKENYLPGWAGTSAAHKAAVRGKYQSIVGAPTASAFA